LPIQTECAELAVIGYLRGAMASMVAIGLVSGVQWRLAVDGGKASTGL
jgi:hypothetical protein